MTGAIRAALVLRSAGATLDEISHTLGRLPDVGRDIGSVGRFNVEPSVVASWEMTLGWPDDVHGGTEGLSTAIEALGSELAVRIAELRPRGLSVHIRVYQDLDGGNGDSHATGLHLTAAAIEWMSKAGAALDLDQYQ